MLKFSYSPGKFSRSDFPLSCLFNRYWEWCYCFCGYLPCQPARHFCPSSQPRSLVAHCISPQEPGRIWGHTHKKILCTVLQGCRRYHTCWTTQRLRQSRGNCILQSHFPDKKPAQGCQLLLGEEYNSAVTLQVKKAQRNTESYSSYAGHEKIWGKSILKQFNI